jgi:tRNA A-37 threonylcarbamoyl transferase component Bud32
MGTSHHVPEPGTLIAGKYRVGEVLAAGGMGVVVEAEHTALGQRVAIKFLRPEAAREAEFVERFLREARAAASLQSDHVIRVFDIGTDERGVPFMVMELLAGNNLEEEIGARGPLPAAEATAYIVEALDAIVEAHAAGIVHRDLKPSNLFLAAKPDGSQRLRVLDFGIAKVSDTTVTDTALTSTKTMLGSPRYMSPEQVRSTKNVDGRTDVWALGVILYELLAGEPAFSGETVGDVFAKIREEDLPPIRGLRPDVPEGLAEVLHGCLQRDRGKRIADAVTLRSRLLPFTAGGEGRAGSTRASPRRRRDAAVHRELMLTAPVVSPGITLAASPTGDTVATWIGDPTTRRRSRLAFGGSLVVTATALSLWFLARAPTHGSAAQPGSASAAAATSAPAVTSPPTPNPAAQPGVDTASTAPAVIPSESASTSAPVHAASAGRLAPRLPPPAPRAAPRPADAALPPSTKKKEDLGI